MARQTVELDYLIGDNVTVIELKRPGKVRSIWMLPTGIQYQVAYFNNGKLEEVYFFSDQITARKKR